MISSVEDPDGLSRATTYTYDAQDRLESVTYPDGFWERMAYDAEDRVTKTVTPFGNSAMPTSLSSLNESLYRITEYEYTPVDHVDDDTTRLKSPRTTTTKSKGQVISKIWSIYTPSETTTIQAATPTASVNESANLVTVTRYLITGEFRGRVESVVNPDGTATLYTYSRQGENLVTTTSAGMLNADQDSIIEGTITTSSCYCYLSC